MRNVNQIRQFRTAELSYPTPDQIRELNVLTHVWKSGDRYYKLAFEYYGSSKVGIIISKNIEQVLHPKNNINMINTNFFKNNEILYSSTRKYNLDKETFSIIFDKNLP